MTTRLGETLDPPKLVAQREQVTTRLTDLVHRFLVVKAAEIGEHDVGRVRSAVAMHLPTLTNSLRSVIGRLASEQVSFDSAPYWMLHDAVGALADSRQGAWPLMGPPERERALGHSMQFAAEVDALLDAQQADSLAQHHSPDAHVHRPRGG